MIVKIKKLNENAVIPFKKHPVEDACYDLVPVSYKYNPKYDRFEYALGFATEFSSDWEAEIRPRSTNTKTDAYIPNTPAPTWYSAILFLAFLWLNHTASTLRTIFITVIRLN